jgi:hypothetical protein
MNIDPLVLNTAYDYVIKRGFPYYVFSLEEKIEVFNKIKRYDMNKVICDDIVRQTMHGLGLAWSYFSHSWSVKTRNMKTPVDIWEDKNILKKAIEKRLKRGGFVMLLPDGSMTDSQIRKALRSYSGVQSVSNFRPTAAAAIYKQYAKDGIVWDMSCGFGGRLLGAFLSDSVKKYIGTDPSTPTYNGLLQIVEDFKYLGIETELHKKGSEEFVPNVEVDLCFTSPPYFNTEKYSDEITQSYLSYDTVSSWNENFLRKTIINCKKCLKDDGHLLLNVADVVTHKTLENDTIRIAEEEGFVLTKTLKMQLSNITKGGFKYEPIFVFKKK